MMSRNDKLGTEWILAVMAVILAVGIMLAAVWVLLTYGGTTFEMIEDRVSGWLDKL
jgi:hypothetical protein